MACAKGLKCCRSHFVRIIRNPVYCGLVTKSLADSEEINTIRGVHVPLVSETLFYEVQDIINTKKKLSSKKHKINSMFFLNNKKSHPLITDGFLPM
jgi:hypothetical protein